MVCVRAHSKGAGARFGRECSVRVPLGSAEPFGAQRPRFARGKRVWWLRFKLHININVITLSRYTYMLFERVVEKSSNARRGIPAFYFQYSGPPASDTVLIYILRKTVYP